MLTAKGTASRQRLIDGAAAEIREHGAAATTLDDVLARTATSKGQLFHYFPGGREERLLAVADYESEGVLQDQQPYLSQLDSWAALDTMPIFLRTANRVSPPSRFPDAMI